MKTEYLKISDLNIDPLYQRGKKSKIKKIAQEWSDEKAGAIIVGRRANGTPWIVDGQQRVEARKLLGKLKVLAVVFNSRGPQHEAETYDAIDNNTISHTPTEKFRSRVTAKDPIALAILTITKNANFNIPYQTDKRHSIAYGRLQCVRAVENLYKKRTLIDVLYLITQCWKDQNESCTEGFLNGLGHFLHIFGDDIDKKKFIKKMKKKPAATLLAEAATKQVSRTQSSFKIAIAGVLFKTYNNYNAQKLSEAKMVLQ